MADSIIWVYGCKPQISNVLQFFFWVANLLPYPEANSFRVLKPPCFFSATCALIFTLFAPPISADLGHIRTP